MNLETKLLREGFSIKTVPKILSEVLKSNLMSIKAPKL